MTKRVKKGFDELLHGRVRACEAKGCLRLSHIANGCEDVVDLSVEACEALGMTAALEDVLEPWERVRDWRKAAEALGIKPEGE